jgi:hypothetical protein
MITKQPFPFLSVQDVALASNLERVTIYRHIALGHIAAIKRESFREYLITAAALQEFLKAKAEGKYRRGAPKKGAK